MLRLLVSISATEFRLPFGFGDEENLNSCSNLSQ